MISKSKNKIFIHIRYYMSVNDKGRERRSTEGVRKDTDRGNAAGERGLGEEEQQGETQKEKYRLGGKAEQEAWAAEVPPHSYSSEKQ